MRRRRRESGEQAIPKSQRWGNRSGAIGLVLSGGGVRAAYQIGALKAIAPYLKRSGNEIRVMIGSSIGAINTLVLSASMKKGVDHAINTAEHIWRERTFRNTFSDSPSMSFFRNIKLAIAQYFEPGPSANDEAVFDPTPLMNIIDEVIAEYGSLAPSERAEHLDAVAIMTTVEDRKRSPLLFASTKAEVDELTMRGASFELCYVDELQARHGFASAALPSILPPVEIDTRHGKYRLVDGGISQNVPVDPAVRLGAERIILIDISGRDWWLARQKVSLDTRPHWEVPAEAETFCVRPADTFVVRPDMPLGSVLKQAVSGSHRKFIKAIGPIWPVYALLKKKLGEEAAYEALSYISLDKDYIHGLIERGYNETLKKLRNYNEPHFHKSVDYQDMFHQVVDSDDKELELSEES